MAAVPPACPAHGRHGFGAWRARADWFLAQWQAGQRNPVMAAHLDWPRSFRLSFESAAQLFSAAKFQAPGRPQERKTAKSAREDLDCSEGGGLTLCGPCRAAAA